MITKGISLLFFGNYFVGLLAIVLSIESAFQLRIPLNHPVYYLSLWLSVVFYYTYAYSRPGNAADYNRRSRWYADNANPIALSQKFIIVLLAGSIAYLLYIIKGNWLLLSSTEWVLIFSFPLAAIAYYGLLPASGFSFNLRNTGWLKAFVIGFVWAGVVTVYPVWFQKLAANITPPDYVLILWYFIKNWMFCTVNAIIFDMKDYANDANRELKTFVVRIGLRRTIFLILLPLTLAGMIALLVFSWYQGFQPIRILMNIIPFLCLLYVAWSMQLRRNILYYLIVIDGMLLVKGICGIAGVWIENSDWVK